MRFLLLPSPFLGPVAWAPVADALRADGHDVRVAPLPAGPVTPESVTSAFVDEAEPGQVLVPHSNAGLYAPTVAARAGADRLVFVDAALPLDHGATRLAPPALAAAVEPLADRHGVLPPWTQWWPPEEVAGLFPDEETQHAVEASEPRVPVAYLHGEVTPPTGWLNGHRSYLAFGETYAEELARSRAAGWPTRVLPGRHLHLLVEPVEVASAVVELAGG